MDSILKEQIQVLKEVLEMKNEIIKELRDKIGRLESKNKIISDITDVKLHYAPFCSPVDMPIGDYGTVSTGILTTSKADGITVINGNGIYDIDSSGRMVLRER